MKRYLLIFGAIFIHNLSIAHSCENKTVKCPIDKTTVLFCETKSMSTFGTYYDLQSYGAVGIHYEELINSCPTCHFSGYLEDFEQKYSVENLSDIRKLLGYYSNMEINEAKECVIAGKIKELLGQPYNEISDCYLVSSYLLRFDTTQTAYRRLVQKNALSFFKKAIECNEYGDPSEIATINYLIGEMYRRTSDFKNAVKYFDLAISDKYKKDWVEEVATKQKELATMKDDNNEI